MKEIYQKWAKCTKYKDITNLKKYELIPEFTNNNLFRKYKDNSI